MKNTAISQSLHQELWREDHSQFTAVSDAFSFSLSDPFHVSIITDMLQVVFFHPLP